MKKGIICFDSDGFFWPDNINDDYMRKERKLISFDGEEQSTHSLFEQYYLGFRSSIFICEDSIEDADEAMKILQTFCEACIGSAISYVKKHIGLELTLPVDFMWIVREGIIAELKNDYPKASEINLRLSMKPRISARTVNENTIVIPALARTVINHCNLVIINSCFRVIGADGHLSGEIDRGEISRFALPYLLFCHDNFSVKNLPIIGAHSKKAVETAFAFTNLQMMFIFAHEYAHILLQHFNNNIAFSSANEKLENEADRFALKVVLGYAKKTGVYSEEDVFTAIRWLFKFQLIEESVGVLIQGGILDIYKSTYEDRRSRFQSELIDSYNVKGSTLLDIVGFFAIVELQNVLYEFGSDLINDIINAFKESDRTGGVEPWWERITKK